MEKYFYLEDYLNWIEIFSTSSLVSRFVENQLNVVPVVAKGWALLTIAVSYLKRDSVSLWYCFEKRKWIRFFGENYGAKMWCQSFPSTHMLRSELVLFFGVFFLFVPGMKSNNQGRMVTEVLGQPWLVVMSVVVLDGFSLANRGRPVKWLVGAAWRSAVWHVKGFPTATSSSTDFFFHEEPIRQDVRLYSEASVRVFAREMVRTSRVERWFWPCLFVFFLRYRTWSNVVALLVDPQVAVLTQYKGMKWSHVKVFINKILALALYNWGKHVSPDRISLNVVLISCIASSKAHHGTNRMFKYSSSRWHCQLDWTCRTPVIFFTFFVSNIVRRTLMENHCHQITEGNWKWFALLSIWSAWSSKTMTLV